jgi:hypothetical protein
VVAEGGDVTRRPGGSDGPEDVDAAFAEIVASLQREGVGVGLVEDVDEERTGDSGARAEPERSEPADGTDRSTPVAATDADPPTGWRTSSVEWDSTPDADDEHFVPPEPPPLPRLRPGTIFGILLLAIGVLLLAAPGLIGLAPRIGTPLALVSLAAGIGWLVLRMRQGPPPDSGWDDGAQL